MMQTKLLVFAMCLATILAMDKLTAKIRATLASDAHCYKHKCCQSKNPKLFKKGETVIVIEKNRDDGYVTFKKNDENDATTCEGCLKKGQLKLYSSGFEFLKPEGKCTGCDAYRGWYNYKFLDQTWSKTWAEVYIADFHNPENIKLSQSKCEYWKKAETKRILYKSLETMWDQSNCKLCRHLLDVNHYCEFYNSTPEECCKWVHEQHRKAETVTYMVPFRNIDGRKWESDTKGSCCGQSFTLNRDCAFLVSGCYARKQWKTQIEKTRRDLEKSQQEHLNKWNWDQKEKRKQANKKGQDNKKAT